MSGSSDVQEFEYGLYPQTAADKQTQNILNSVYSLGNLTRTNYSFTRDKIVYDQYDTPFESENNIVYEYQGNMYVQVEAKTYNSEFKLSNNEIYHFGDKVWVEVKPVKWLYDNKSQIALTKDIIFAGVQFNRQSNYQSADFDETDIKQYMDTYLANELVQNISLDLNQSQETEEKINPYNFDFSLVSEEEIIKGAIESNIAVFLHGRSSEGKSARVKQLDPDCEILYMRNATPESLNGKSAYNSTTGEMIDIPPTWYQKVCQKCEKEPNKIHLIFFDELTNALPSIQGMAFNIILDKEVNGRWKLPENARIVAAGNDLKDSLAANMMAEPLFNRFAHVYINTTVESWLKWAKTPNEEYQRLDY